MPRIAASLGAVALVAATLLPATAATAVPADPVPPVAAVPAVRTDVNDFRFASFDARYELGRDADDRSTLRVHEELVAVFPDVDQNRGIIRAIPSTYDGHPTDLRIQSVTDENGTPRDYDTEFENGALLVTIAVPEGEYVHGEQHYVIEYTQRDVTRYFENTDNDEFYWDTNGLGWAQPFDRVSAEVVLPDDLIAALTGDAACYYGGEGATNRCDIQRTESGYEASVTGLLPYQNMTVAIGFQAGTFAAAPFDLFSWVPLVTMLGALAFLVSLVLAIVLRATRLRNAAGRGIVIAQYEPPEGVSVLTSANIAGKRKRGFAALIVDLAVRRKLRIIERGEDGWLSKEQFGVQHLDGSGLLADEQRGMTALFAGAGADGVRWFSKKDTSLGSRVVKLTTSVAKQTLRSGLRRKPPGRLVAVVGLLVAAGFALSLFGSITATNEFAEGVGIATVIAGSWLGVAALILTAGRRPLTRDGALLREHLEGLELYIRLAEADRLQMLQSVTGAERIATDRGDVVKIYERLLPYAVMFGLEDEWATELAKYYDETPPDWYSGSGAFNVAVFSAGIGSLSTQVSTSYSGSSSSSGGSGGGGSSGGGGGGGGGGGI